MHRGASADWPAYVLEEARRHQEEISGFSKENLKLIMRHAMRQIERARFRAVGAGNDAGRAKPNLEETNGKG